MTTDRYDAVVLGTGNAGFGAAGPIRKAGKRVAIVEALEVGGTCALRGCVPKKVLVAAAETLDVIERASTHAIDVSKATLNWSALIDRELDMIAKTPSRMRESLKERGIELAEGRASFTGPTSVRVGDRTLEANVIVVAVGSEPRSLPFEGSEHLKSSADLLRMRERPRRAAFVGAGVIAFEFAHVLSRAGTEVTMLEAMPRALARFDEATVDRLVTETRRLGVTVETGVRVEGIAKRDQELVVTISQEGSTRELRVDQAIHGAGRVPAISALELDKGGVDLDEGRPLLDPYLRSRSNPHVWFAGDARGPGPQLSPVATYEGRLVAHNVLHPDDLQAPDYSSIPAAVFTMPTLATVGRTESEARADGVDFDVRENDMADWLSARTYGERAAYSKVLVDRGTGAIVGAHLLGHGAGETIHAFALAMRHGLPAEALAEMVYAYPTFHADLRNQL